MSRSYVVTAVFRNASLHSATTCEVLDLIALNLSPAASGPPLPSTGSCARGRAE